MATPVATPETSAEEFGGPVLTRSFAGLAPGVLVRRCAAEPSAGARDALSPKQRTAARGGVS